METKQWAESLPTGIDNPPVPDMAPCRKQMIENKANTGILRQMLKMGGCINTSLLEEFFVYIKVWTQILGNRKNSKTVLETSWKLLAF